MSAMQLAIDYGVGAGNDEAGRHLLKLLRAVVDVVGVKQVAFDLDTSPSGLLHALEGKDRHLPAKWIPYLIRKAPSDEIVEFLAGLRGLEVQPRVELTAEQRLERLEEAMSETLGEDIRRVIQQRARRGRRT